MTNPSRFSDHLARYGPYGAAEPPSLGAARYYCATLARGHYENFIVASGLLPRWLLKYYYPVYAYCRWADDLADETDNPQQALTLLAWWREQIELCYTGWPRHPVMVALLPTIKRFAIPKEPFLALLIAFEQDQYQRHYATFAELLTYCHYSANPVGELLLYLFDAHTPENVKLANHICTALQLTNFWQDVARDYRIGRVYLPEQDRQQMGYSDADLHAQRWTPAFAALMRHEIEQTRALFDAGAALSHRLPNAFRVDVELFRQGGLAILKKIEQLDYNVWQMRPKLSKWEQVRLFLGVLARHRNPWGAPG